MVTSNKDDALVVKSKAGTEIASIELNKEDIKKYIAPNSTDKELALFMGICQSFQLNPFKREVHFIKYGEGKAQTIVGYEVYIKRADRTGKLDGWSVQIGDDEKSATITIHRKDWENPFVWTIDRSEFDKGQANWKSMPRFMLKKVAIAQGFRLAFPDELGGMPYMPEELPDAKTTSEIKDITSEVDLKDENTTPKSKEVPEEKADMSPQENTISEETQAKICMAFSKYGITQEDLEKARNKPASEWTEQDRKDLGDVYQDIESGTLDPDVMKD